MTVHEPIVHTYFSFLAGASSPKDLIKTAAKYGYRSLAITDFDGVYGIARAYRALQDYKRHHETDLKLHYGAEIHLNPDHELPILHRHTLVLIAMSALGYNQLCTLLTQAHERGKTTAWISVDELGQINTSDLIAIVPMRGPSRDWPQARWTTDLSQLKSIFGDRLYLSITRTRHPAEDARISPTLAASDALQIPFIFSQDVFFHRPHQRKVADLLTAIRCSAPLDQIPDQLWPNSERCLHPLKVLRARYASIPDSERAWANANALANRIHFDLSMLRYRYPSEMVPAGLSAQAYLTQEVWRLADQRYAEHIPESVKAILRHELTLVEQLEFADYFLTVYDIVSWARSQNILCQGRGSAANSAICFVLGITAIDPSQFDLLFERFISVERGDPPDIDVDFEHERREEVIQYIYSRYGRHRAAMVCNVICFKSRGALRFSGQALGIPEPLLDQAAQILNSRHFRASAAINVIQEIQAESPHELPDYLWTLWAKMADLIRGIPRHLGIHSGGFIISQHPITALSPVEPATMENRSVVQWCKEDIEGLGFFKIDILALGGLTLIKKCLTSVKTHFGKELTMDTIPADDPDTYDMICRADTVGTFQIESRAQMSFLPKHQPRNFYDLVVQVAIIRPGPIQGGMIHPYLRRRRGDEPVNFPDSRLIPILKRTFGVPIFQEQVMRVAIAVGGFTPGESDELRKNIGAFTLNLDQAHWVNRLQSGMRKNGISDTFIEGIIGHIHGFASYGFPESHAASFALIAYATAYLKCHYPACFFQSILNSLPMGFYSVDVLVKTAQRCGVKVLPICILNSRWDHQLESHDGKWAIRLGFRLIRGLNKTVGQALQAPSIPVGKIENPYHLLIEILTQTRFTKSDLTALAAANAFHRLGIDRKAAIWLAEAVPIARYLDDLGPPLELGPDNPITEVQLDYTATGTSLGLHPAALMKAYGWAFPVPVQWLTQAPKIKEKATRTGVPVLVFGMVTVRQSPPTAKGVVFITLWDETGSYDLIIRPETYNTYRKLIDKQSFLCIRGKAQLRENTVSVIVTEVISPTIPKGAIIPFPEDIPEFDEGVRNYM